MVSLVISVVTIMVLKILIISYFSSSFSAPQGLTLAISVIQILQKYNLNHLANQTHLYLYDTTTILVNNEINLFPNILLLPPPPTTYRPSNCLSCENNNHNHITVLVKSFFRFYMSMRVVYMSCVFTIFVFYVYVYLLFSYIL